MNKRNRQKLIDIINEIDKINNEKEFRKKDGDFEGVKNLTALKDNIVDDLIICLSMELFGDRTVESKDELTPSIKNDRLDDKLRWELLPLEDIEDIVKVYTAGAKKYGADKWQNLPDGLRRYKAALLRHLVEFDKGNEIDEETGCRHLAQVAWNAIAMLHISKQQKKDENNN